MKKIITIICSAVIALILASPAMAKDITAYNKDLELSQFKGSVIMSPTNEKIAFVDGIEVKGTKSIVTQGTTLVPLRFVSENLKATVNWKKEAPKNIILKMTDGKILILNIGSKEILINGTPKKISATPKMINNVTYLPLRAIGEALDKRVDYDKTYKIIYIMDQTVDKNLSNTSYIYAPLYTAFKGDKVLFADTFVIITADTKGREYAWDLNTRPQPNDLSKAFWGKYFTHNGVKYLWFHVGDNTMCHDYVYTKNTAGNYEIVENIPIPTTAQ